MWEVTPTHFEQYEFDAPRPHPYDLHLGHSFWNLSSHSFSLPVRAVSSRVGCFAPTKFVPWSDRNCRTGRQRPTSRQQALRSESVDRCYGKSYWFFSVVVIRNIFIRKLSHLTISSPFISINQKMHKNHSSFWIDFCCYSLSSYAPACRHFCYLLHGFFR